MKLHAVCWQDSSEPWGWAPATEHVPDGALPEGPFFWDRQEAEKAIVDVRERAAAEHMGLVRDRDRERYAREQRVFSEWQANQGRPRPGAYVRVVGAVADPPAVPMPTRLATIEELEEEAAEMVNPEWSIQTYDLPER